MISPAGRRSLPGRRASCGLSAAAGQEDLAEGVGGCADGFGGDAGEEVCVDLAGNLQGGPRQVEARGGELYPAAAAVVGVGGAFDVAGFGEALQDVAGAARGEDQGSGEFSWFEAVGLARSAEGGENVEVGVGEAQAGEFGTEFLLDKTAERIPSVRRSWRPIPARSTRPSSRAGS